MTEVQPERSPVVLVRDLSKRYKNGAYANRGISFQASAGECIAVLGPNGAGKTTFLRQLTTELAPTSGSVSILGVDAIREPVRVKRSLGVTPQDAGLFETLTVREHLELFGRIKGLSRNEAKAETGVLLDRLDLTVKSREPVGSLSGGQKRRVLIGLALLGGPPILILDEPTTGLDPSARRGVWRLLESIARDGTTIIFSTHYLEEAEALSDRIDIIVDGQIVKSGALATYQIGSPHRYRLEYRVASRDRRTQFFSKLSDVQAFVDEGGISDFQIASVSLEDVYFSYVPDEADPTE